MTKITHITNIIFIINTINITKKANMTDIINVINTTNITSMIDIGYQPYWNFDYFSFSKCCIKPRFYV